MAQQQQEQEPQAQPDDPTRQEVRQEGQQHIILAPDDADAAVPMVEWVGLLPRLNRRINEILETKLPYFERKAANTITILYAMEFKIEGLEGRVIEMTSFLYQRLGDVQVPLHPDKAYAPRPTSPQLGPSGNQPGRSQGGSNSLNLRSCLFCGDARHWATACLQFKTLSARKKRLEELNRCERCLTKADHTVTNCKTKSFCSYCRKDGRSGEMSGHHSAFYFYITYQFDW
ncbi:hypothetical protein Aduo_014791 [Ancylostoma duodenale]